MSKEDRPRFDSVFREVTVTFSIPDADFSRFRARLNSMIDAKKCHGFSVHVESGGWVKCQISGLVDAGPLEDLLDSMANFR